MSDQAPATVLARKLAGKWIAAAISTAAQLSLADHLAAGPLTADELADKTSCEAQAMARLLSVLAIEGLVKWQPGGRYLLTEVGQQLQSDKLRDLAIYTGAAFNWQPWARLPDTIRTGDSAFRMVHGLGLFDYLDGHAEDSRLYQAAVNAFTRVESRALAEQFDFSSFDTIVDLGGGLGLALLEILTAHDHLHGTLLERAIVIAQAKQQTSAGLAGRLDYVTGDFFKQVPSSDLYLIMHVLHNWDDDSARGLLQKCATSLHASGRILVVERVLLPGEYGSDATYLDMEMLALFGAAKERRQPELRELFSQAGLALDSSVTLSAHSKLFVCKKK